MIIKHNGKITTPFGTFPDAIIPELCRKAGLKIVDEEWVFIAKKVPVERERAGKVTNEEVWIPVRAYNFEVHLLEQKDVSKALAKTTDDYLPAQRDVSSYSILLKEITDKNGGIQEIDWADIASRSQAYEQLLKTK